MNKWLNFSGDADHRLDTGIVLGVINVQFVIHS